MMIITLERPVPVRLLKTGSQTANGISALKNGNLVTSPDQIAFVTGDDDSAAYADKIRQVLLA